MKTCWLILTFAALGVVLLAQTNQPTPLRPEGAQTHITSTGPLEFDLPTATWTFRENVRVDDPQLKLTCEYLSGRFMSNNPKFGLESIVAETNVVIYAIDWEGRTNHATADKLTYFYSVTNAVTNQTLVLTGNARLTNYTLGVDFLGDPIFVDLVRGKVFARNPSLRIQTEGAKFLSDQDGAKTNLPTQLPK